MPASSIPLSRVFDGWEGYNTSLVHAIQPLTQAQLTWRPAEHLRTVGDLAGHIAFGRIGWFARMPAPGSLELMKKPYSWATNPSSLEIRKSSFAG